MAGRGYVPLTEGRPTGTECAEAPLAPGQRLNSEHNMKKTTQTARNGSVTCITTRISYARLDLHAMG